MRHVLEEARIHEGIRAQVSDRNRDIVEEVERAIAEHDLVVVGVDAANYVHPLRQSLGDATIAIARRTPPLRLRAMADWLPRINPAILADLRHDLRVGSNWGPDFIAMLGLASAIASLGSPEGHSLLVGPPGCGP